MKFYGWDFKKLAFLTLLLALPLITINMEHRPRAQDWYAQPFAFMGSQIESTYYAFSQGVRSTTAMYFNLVDIKKENSNLKNENAELKAMLSGMTELKAENERLYSLLNFKQASKMDLLAAQVVGRDLSIDHSRVLINRGANDGLKTGQAVMTIEGAVGHIYRTTSNSAQVLLLTDRYSVVDGIVQRSRTRGLVEGRSASTASLKYVNKSEDVRPGDLIVTSGLDNIFPKGLPVAQIEKVDKKPFSVTLDIELKPVVDPNKLEEIFVVLNTKGEDLSPQEEATATEAPKVLVK